MNNKPLSINIYFVLYLKWIVLVVTAFTFAGCTMNLHPELVKRGEGFPGSEKCGDCHIDIYDEWSKSRHAKSYTSEEFRVSTNNYEFKFCLGCHVPETIFTSSIDGHASEEILPRSHGLEEGVDCQSCHLTKDCTLAGPHSGISPHPIQNEEKLYRSSSLCGKCHIDTFKEYLKYASKADNETCQDCHMPTVNRKLIQDEPWQKLHANKEGKAHTFSSADAMKAYENFLELTFTDIKYDTDQLSGILEVENTMSNHSIPTGQYGYRELLLSIYLKNSLGNIVKSKHESMFIEMGTQLKPNEKRILPFTFDVKEVFFNNENKELEAVLFKTNFDRTNKILLAKEELKLN